MHQPKLKNKMGRKPLKVKGEKPATETDSRYFIRKFPDNAVCDQIANAQVMREVVRLG